jgi:hypothetical protein
VSQWPFDDPPDLDVISNKEVAFGWGKIVLFTHDAGNGGWQFLSHKTAPLSESDGVVVSLREIAELGPTVGELANLPQGWRAWRKFKGSPWQCTNMS